MTVMDLKSRLHPAVETNKKIILGAMAAVALIVAILGYCSAAFESDDNRNGVGTETRDIFAQKLVKDKTANTLSGRININKKLAMPRGVVVAYRAVDLTKAIGSGKIGESGTYALDNLPQAPVTLFIKSSLSSDPNAAQSMMQNGFTLHHVDGKNRRRNPDALISPRTPIPFRKAEEYDPANERLWMSRRPPISEFNKIHSFVYLPEYDKSASAQWLIAGAYIKYGSMSAEGEKLTRNIDEGENTWDIDLIIP